MIRKIRFIEPGTHLIYKKSISNYFTYNRSIVNPAIGLITLATIAKRIINDTLMYSEAISKINFEDIYDSDIIFISIFTFNAKRGYEIAEKIKRQSNALIVFGGLHASLYYTETINYCDYILRDDGDESIVDFIHRLNDNKPVDFPGVIYKKNDKIVNTGNRIRPENIDTIPNRDLVHNYSKLAKKYDTLWPQVHASRGCSYNCSYCSIIHHFGRKIRKRSPQNVVADIKEAIDFHKRKIIPRLMNTLWITDDRKWAISVLNEIIKNKIKYNFYVQARIEIGFDDEILELMKKARFHDLALGIESLDDNTLKNFNKANRYSEIIRSINNIQNHGIGVYGLFIVGSEDDTKGIGQKIAQFVEEHKLHGALIQSLFFTPGTPFYDKNKEMLIHQDWNKYDGNVVHFPKKIKPDELQNEIIIASKNIYSIRRLIYAIFNFNWINKIIFIGNYFWQINLRRELKSELLYLKNL